MSGGRVSGGGVSDVSLSGGGVGDVKQYQCVGV